MHIYEMGMHKQERQQFIKELIRTERIARQSVIAERLAGRGLTVTQASVSRDLEELGIAKVGGIYQESYAATRSPDLRLRSLNPAGPNLLVARCDPGLASAITVRIDSLGIPAIIGTIAGDDTIFVAVPDAEAQAKTREHIWGIFGR